MVYGNDSSSRLVENMSVVVPDYQRVHNKEQTNIRMRSRLENGYAVFYGRNVRPCRAARARKKVEGLEAARR
jgi:hypothetical protein